MTDSISSLSRIFSLLLGGLLVVFLSSVLSRINGTTFVAAVFQTAFMLGLIVVCIILFSRNLARSNASDRRLSLSSMFYVAIPFAVYAAFVGQIVRGTVPNESLNLYGASLILFYGSIFVFVCTGILIRVADALVWIWLCFAAGYYYISGINEEDRQTR